LRFNTLRRPSIALHLDNQSQTCLQSGYELLQITRDLFEALAMGIDMGFDMIPRLEKTREDDLDRWSRFMSDIEEQYEDDSSVDMSHPCYVEFRVAEHPMLPYEGHKFLRFSSKISGRQAFAAEEYIREVFRLARARFGERVRLWHDCKDESMEGIYEWEEVNESIRSFTAAPKVSSSSGTRTERQSEMKA
jgi:hypothetical protein